MMPQEPNSQVQLPYTSMDNQLDLQDSSNQPFNHLYQNTMMPQPLTSQVQPPYTSMDNQLDLQDSSNQPFNHLYQNTMMPQPPNSQVQLPYTSMDNEIDPQALAQTNACPRNDHNETFSTGFGDYQLSPSPQTINPAQLQLSTPYNGGSTLHVESNSLPAVSSYSSSGAPYASHDYQAQVPEETFGAQTSTTQADNGNSSGFPSIMRNECEHGVICVEKMRQLESRLHQTIEAAAKREKDLDHQARMLVERIRPLNQKLNEKEKENRYLVQQLQKTTERLNALTTGQQ